MIRFLQRGPYRELERRLGYRFRKRHWIEQALTHRSFRFEQPDADVDNQRLEFLGDAALGLVAAAHMFRHFEAHDEGMLTNMRSEVTSGKALADVAARIELGDFMRVGRGEERAGGRKRQSTLADALEAVLGAAYLDGGLAAVTRIFEQAFIPALPSLSGDMWAENPKGKLQDLSQRRWKSSPAYRLTGTVGPAHKRVFSCEVRLGDGTRGMGGGCSKREAEKAAALDALARIGHDSDVTSP